MHSYKQLLFQIVFATKSREKTLVQNREKIFAAMRSICSKYYCKVYAINGVEDHVHIAISIPSSMAPSQLIQRLKIESNLFIKKTGLCPKFRAWQRGYGLFTYHTDSRNRLVQYIKNQEQHHAKNSYDNEMKALLLAHKIDFNQEEFDQYLNE